MSEPKQLLIIDDDPDFVAGIKAILVKAKYEVDVAYNPKDGLAGPEIQSLRPAVAGRHDGPRGRGDHDRPQAGQRPQAARPARADHHRHPRTNGLPLPRPGGASALCGRGRAGRETGRAQAAPGEGRRRCSRPPKRERPRANERRPCGNHHGHARLRRTTASPSSRRSATCCTPRRATRSTPASSAAPARPPVRWRPAASWTIRRAASSP